MPSRYAVGIVGAGPTGLVLANLLGQSGVRTLLVEANAATVGEPRAVSIDDETLRVVQEMGLLEIVGREIVSGYGSEYLGPDRSRFLKVKPEERPYGHPRRNAFRQPVFEAQLREGLLRFPAVETRFCCKAVSFDEVPDGVQVGLESRNGASDQVLFDYLIGCDGSWSPVREGLGYTLAGDSLNERWLIIDLEDSPNASPETTVYCDPKRPGIALPGPRNTRRYEFKLMPGETDATVLADETISELLRNHDVVPGSRIIRQTVYHFHARIATRWGRGRVWLAGDAAHLMPPFAGQGMNGGVRDAANLAWKLRAIVEGRLGSRLLETYEQERRGHVEQMIRLALRMGTIFGPKSTIHGLAIRAGFRLMGLWPGARSWFAEMKYKPAPRFDDGFLLTSQLTRRGIVGRMLPQPPLPSSYGGQTLDKVLGTSFALLGCGVDQVALDTITLGPDWDALIARRVSLSVADLPDLVGQEGQVLLVRPDRYVMARFTAADAERTRPSLDALRKRTWRVEEQPETPRAASTDNAAPTSSSAASEVRAVA